MEVASDRLLALMEKGITVAQVARIASAFTEAGIMVHAYLMYGFPTETAEETIESLDRVRQLFAAGVLHSAFWHRFTATRHSPVGMNPDAYGITLAGPPKGPFANNDLIHIDPAGCDPALFGPGLAKAIYNYMHGIELDRDVRSWFDFPAPRSRVPADFIDAALTSFRSHPELEGRVVWLGGKPLMEPAKERGKKFLLHLPGRDEDLSLSLEGPVAEWCCSLLAASRPRGRKQAPLLRLGELKHSYPSSSKKSFDTFLKSKEWNALRAAGLLLL
jgi:hypothetical protein